MGNKEKKNLKKQPHNIKFDCKKKKKKEQVVIIELQVSNL